MAAHAMAAQEYREVLDALSTAYLAAKKKHDQLRAFIANGGAILYSGQLEEPEKLNKQAENAENESFRIFCDRTFTTDELQSAQIEFSWRDALEDLDRDHGTYEFSLKYDEIRRKVLDLARGNSVRASRDKGTYMSSRLSGW